MVLFIAVLTESTHVHDILQEFADEGFHGSVLSTRSIRHALMDTIEPEPYFGGLSKVVEGEEVARPMIFMVCKKEETTKLMELVNKATGGIKGKGFMFTMPMSHLEGLED